MRRLMSNNINSCLILVYFCALFYVSSSIFVDTGNPYKDLSLKVGEITLQETIEGSPLHTKAWFPLATGAYPVVFFVGGLNGLVLAELYSTVLYDISTHGFFVFGVDYKFPAYDEKKAYQLGQDIAIFFKQLNWLENYFANRTESTPLFNATGLMCHSSGCDVTLRMIGMKQFNFTSNIFLEAFSTVATQKLNIKLPSLMYGTQYAEEGAVPCNIKGFDSDAIYSAWNCPKIAINVAGVGHCDILDPIPWEGCHYTGFCKTTNNTYLPQYRKFVQGVISSFFIATLQGRMIDLQYITNSSLHSFQYLELKTDLNC